MINKKLLYIGGIFEGSTGKERYSILKKWFIIDLIKTDKFFKERSFIKKLINKISNTLYIKYFNSFVQRNINDKESYEYGFISKCYILNPNTVLKIKDRCKLLIHYTPDKSFTINNEDVFNSSIKIFDICVTTKKSDVENYKEYGAKKVLWVPQSINTDKYIDVASQTPVNKNVDIIFIGRKEKYYEEVINKVVHNLPSSNIKVYGDQWLKPLGRSNDIYKAGVWDRDYIKTLANAKIGLGLLSKLVSDEATTRSIEIPAAGTFLLAERTDEHQEMYEEGVEAEFFGEHQELLDKIQYYLKHDVKREEIAAKGQKKAMHYNNDIILQEIFSKVNEDI